MTLSFKTITTRGSIIREACKNFWKYLVSLMELRHVQLQAAKTFLLPRLRFVSCLSITKYYCRADRRNMGSSAASIANVSDGRLSRPNFSFYFAQPKKYRLVGCFHVDFGAKILTISSFSSLKRALICNNMLTVNIFGLCALRNLICRFKVSIESFRFRKRSLTFRVLKLVSINVVFKHRFAPCIKYLRIV